MKNCRASSLKAIRMPWEIFCIISGNCGKFLANGPGKVLPSSSLEASPSYYADFHRRPSLFCWRIRTDIGLGIRLLVLIGELSFGWRGLFRLVGGFLRVSPKGLTRRPSGKSLWTSGIWWHPEVTGARERERLSLSAFLGNRGHRGAYSPYKPLNHNLYIGIIIFPHNDNPQSTGYN